MVARDVVAIDPNHLSAIEATHGPHPVSEVRVIGVRAEHHQIDRKSIDLHTSSFAATITKKKEVKIRTFKIKPLRITGAGDAWNAGNIIGDMNKLSDESRLMLANAVSAYYISFSQGSYPNRKKISNFIKKELKTT